HAPAGSTMPHPLREGPHTRAGVMALISPMERKTVPITALRNPGVSLPFTPRILTPAAAASGAYSGIRRPVGPGVSSRADASTVSGNGARMAAPAYSGSSARAPDPARDARA